MMALSSLSSMTADGEPEIAVSGAGGSAPAAIARSSGPMVVLAMADNHFVSSFSVIWRCSASSSSVGARPSRCSSSANAFSTCRALLRTDLGTQSS